jgi:hypothetical protein
MASLLTGTLERTVGWLHVPRRSSDAAEVIETTPARRRQAARPLDLRLRQLFCGTTIGHDFIRGIDGRRMYLICQRCFHETPGWTVEERRRRND